jgi:hypothetical protein
MSERICRQRPSPASVRVHYDDAVDVVLGIDDALGERNLASRAGGRFFARRAKRDAGGHGRKGDERNESDCAGRVIRTSIVIARFVTSFARNPHAENGADAQGSNGRSRQRVTGLGGSGSSPSIGFTFRSAPF